jgi:hypothetical protein
MVWYRWAVAAHYLTSSTIAGKQTIEAYALLDRADYIIISSKEIS